MYLLVSGNTKHRVKTNQVSQKQTPVPGKITVRCEDFPERTEAT